MSERVRMFLAVLVILSASLLIALLPHSREKRMKSMSRSEIEVYALAVKGKGEGIVIPVKIELIDGNGRLLLDISNPTLYLDTQVSAKVALEVAKKFVGEKLRKKDVIISIETKEMVSGPSAGALLAVAIIALAEGKKLKKNVFITGQITPEGKIYPVGGILAKAMAAKEFGAEKILVPKGEAYQLVPIEKCVEKKGFGMYVRSCEIFYERRSLEELVGMEVEEVSDVEEALRVMLE